MDFRSKGLEPTVGCGFKIENFGLESATPPLNPQYGKEWSSKISGFGFFFNVPFFKCPHEIFLPRRDTTGKKETARFSKKEAQKKKNTVLLILLDHSFPYCEFKGRVADSSPKFSILKPQPSVGSFLAF